MKKQQWSDVFEFQERYSAKEEREAHLRTMSNQEIEKLIQTAGSVQAKIYYASFKKDPLKHAK